LLHFGAVLLILKCLQKIQGEVRLACFLQKITPQHTRFTAGTKERIKAGCASTKAFSQSDHQRMVFDHLIYLRDTTFPHHARLARLPEFLISLADFQSNSRNFHSAFSPIDK
jgi:hypothetical protein